MTRELTAAELAELKRLQSYFPYRIVFGVIDKDTVKMEAYARPTKAGANFKARQGHAVFILERVAK